MKNGKITLQNNSIYSIIGFVRKLFQKEVDENENNINVLCSIFIFKRIDRMAGVLKLHKSF